MPNIIEGTVETVARMHWQNPDGLQGCGDWLPVIVAQRIAKGYKADEPRRIVQIEYSGRRMEIIEEQSAVTPQAAA
jgi:hypothetical protein